MASIRPLRRTYSKLASRARGLARRLGPGAKRRLFDLKLVQSSLLFDRDWYLENYPDVAQAGIDPLVHFMELGWREGRDPGTEFATSAYLKANADVAASGINPLLHYIEFGHAEGRGTFAHRTFGRGAPRSFSFASASPCASFPLPEQRLAPWQRSNRLDARHPDLVRIGSWSAGYAQEPDMQAKMCAASSLLGFLSGYAEEGARTKASELPRSTEKLIDAWYVNAAQLRTRWTGKKLPFVVRAFQHDPLGDEMVSLVGEGLVSSPVDLVDLYLNNGLLPVLLVFAQPDGSLTGSRLFAFPSLCRGGRHYLELVRSAAAAIADGITDPLRESDRLAARLLRLIRRVDAPAISRIEVDLDGADGTGPLFQSDVRKWLEKVARIGVSPCSSGNRSAGEDFLAETMAVSPSPERDDQGTTFVLGPDMVPTIAALTEARVEGNSAIATAVVPLLVEGRQSAQPATCIELPGGIIGAVDGFPDGHAGKWPRLLAQHGSGLPMDFPPGAIRRSRGRDLHDAELLTPVGDGGLEQLAGVREGITWLIHVQESKADDLVHTVQALALQNGAAADAITFLGSADPRAVSVARDAFEDRVNTVANVRAAVRGLDTPLAGFISAHVVLHDNRSACVLAAMLDNDSVDSASCVLVSTERRGKAWHAAIVDPGALAAPSGRPLDHSENSLAAKQLLRSTYPVAAPSPDLWVARSALLETWVEGAAQNEGAVHMCTSLITATCSRKREDPYTPAFDLRASPNCVTKIAALIG
jgi:hypothetical protein